MISFGLLCYVVLLDVNGHNSDDLATLKRRFCFVFLIFSDGIVEL